MPPEPLTPAVHAILLALAPEPQHGYAIMQQARDHGLSMGPGTLYGSLNRLLESQLILEIDPPRSSAADDPTQRRRFYKLTAAGRQALAAETQRMHRAVTAARRHGIPITAPKEA